MSAVCLSLPYVKGILFNVMFGFVILPTSDSLSTISISELLLFVPCCVFVINIFESLLFIPLFVFSITMFDPSIFVCFTSLFILDNTDTTLSNGIFEGDEKL